MLLQIDYVYHLHGVKKNLPDTGISCHLPVFKDSLIISWHKDIFKDSLIIFWYKDIFLLPQKKIFPPAHLCTRRPHQLQNVEMVVCSSVWPNRKVVKLKIKAKGTSVPPPSPGMVLPLAKGPTPPKPPKRPPSQHRPMPELLSLIKLIKSTFKTTPVDEAFCISYDHLLSKNLCEDVVRDVLTAPTPGNPLTHTCRGSSTKNPTRSSALTLTIMF